MPQDGITIEGRRSGTCDNTCKENRQVPGTDLLNRAVIHNRCPAAAATTSESTSDVTLNDTKQRCRVNGYIKCGYKRKCTKTKKKQGSRDSAVTDASTAGRVSSEDIIGGIAVNGATSPDTVALPHNSDQMAQELSLPAVGEKQRRGSKFRYKKRDTEVVYPEKAPLKPPNEKEDWENEIQGVTFTDWEKICLGGRHYNPQDLLHFSLRDLTLEQRGTGDLALTVSYTPAVHHAQPLRWSSLRFSTEPDQFIDAE